MAVGPRFHGESVRMMLPVLLAAATVSTVASGSPLVARLVAEGFENVAVESRAEKTIVWFEDRRSLDASEGMGYVARQVAQEEGLSHHVELVPLHEGLPVIGVLMPLDVLRDFLADRKGSEAFGAQLDFDLTPPGLPGPGANPSFWRPELFLTPGYYFSDRLNGYLNNSLQSQIAPGWHALGRLQLQFYPEWSLSPTYGLIGGHRSLTPRTDAAWSVGRWNSDRYGAEGELAGWLGGGEWLWHVRASLVTTLVPSLVGGCEYRWPWLDTYTRLGGGFYPAGDRAVYATFGRRFPRSEFEVGYFRSDFGNQLRASLTLYLGQTRRPDPRPFRVEVPGWLMLDYRASAPSGATLLWPEPEAGVAWRRLTPDYLRRHLAAWRLSAGGRLD